MTALEASILLWDFWVVSWLVAAFWRRRTVGRPPIGQRMHYVAPTALGVALLFFGSARPGAFGSTLAPGDRLLWALPHWASWLATFAVAAGLAFTWWARLGLGDLWSGAVARKEGHVVVRTGAYGLVRHPIYSGLIFAGAAMAIQVGTASNIAGTVLVSSGLWLKARLEERFLGATLGQAYADYKRTTPMLTPFWPAHR
jgi:protein-S-isoprenylcysteine O-methyltransferase Ste14